MSTLPDPAKPTTTLDDIDTAIAVVEDVERPDSRDLLDSLEAERAQLANKLGLAVAARTYRAYRELLSSDRCQRLENLGARPQRLLWASTSTKDPTAPDTRYVEGLAAPHTINTMPDATLLAFADHGRCERFLPADGGNADDVLRAYADAGVDVPALAERLQREGADAFTASWRALLECIETKRAAVRGAGAAAA